MIFTKQTKAALDICYAAHQNQLDKGGMPYVFHPYRVAEQMQTEDEVTVALLAGQKVPVRCHSCCQRTDERTRYSIL